MWMSNVCVCDSYFVLVCVCVCVCVQFLSCSVRGVFSSVFCDFGPEFMVVDKDGEEPLECFIGNITKVTIKLVST